MTSVSALSLPGLMARANCARAQVVGDMIAYSLKGNIDVAYARLESLWKMGYAASDLVSTVFRVVQNYDMPEYTKLEYLSEVRPWRALCCGDSVASLLR